MRKFIGFSAVAFLSALFFAGTVAAQTIKWQVHTINPAKRWTTRSQVSFAKEIERRTNGRLKMTVFPSGSLGIKGRDILDAVSNNLVPLAQVWGSHVGGQEQIMELFALPSFVAWEPELMVRLWEGLKDDYDRLLSKRYRVRLVTLLQNEPRNLHTIKRVTRLADLRGLKIRTVGALESTYTKLIGGVPVSINWGELYTALSTGVADGNWAGNAAEVGMKFYESVRYTFETKGGGIGIFVCVSEEALEKLPPDVRKIFWETAGFLEKELRKGLMASAASGRKKLIEVGKMTFLPVPKADMRRMREAASPILKKWVSRLDPESLKIYQKAKSIIDAYHAGR